MFGQVFDLLQWFFMQESLFKLVKGKKIRKWGASGSEGWKKLCMMYYNTNEGL